MNTMQKGFTLIELMIVVAIIGILAAIAVPAYQDYTIKAKISEAASLSGAVKLGVELAYSEGMALADIDSNTDASVEPATSYKAKYVSSVSIIGDGEFEVLLIDDSALGLNTAKGKKITYTPESMGGNLKWTLSCEAGIKAAWCPKS
ncbi:MAG: prepilin-type N-terminal cleavage/methylation domain-containing protein [Acidiferrobacterales bacterium]